MGAAEDRLLACRARVVHARAEAARRQLAYFETEPATRALVDEYARALRAVERAEHALQDARVAAAVEGTWVARPELYRAPPA